MRKYILLPFVLLCVACGPKWESLFNGKDLQGWHPVGGEAVFEVVDGCIETYPALQGPNSFLATDKAYGDFILEYEFMADEGANSGVQLRSHLNEEGKVYGYQIEIDTGLLRRWTGGIYDEGRRCWLYPLSFNQPARDAYRPGEWNKGRVEFVGSRLRSFINGVPCADMIDDADASGFIALQSHTQKPELKDKAVRFRNIRILTGNPARYMLPETGIYQVNAIANTVSDRQSAEGWRLLWDGKTTEGWRSARGEAFPDRGWSIEDGILKVWENDGAESANGGDIITVDMYENFWLSVDFKITDGANSGIKYFVRPDLYHSDASAIGCEYQILDDERHPDAKLGKDGNRTLASLYDLITADKSEAWYRHRQWNNALIKVEGNHVEHWLNGVKVLEYERNTPEFNELVAGSKYKNWENFGNHAKGHILLQDHGHEVWYKNILIKELP